MKFLKLALIASVGLGLGACTRVETGTVGVRTDMSRNVEKEERTAGTWNQVMFGDITIFPFKDVQVDINDLTPLAADNSTIKDFDFSIVYSINPTQVADLYIAKSKAFHATNDDGEIFLMYNYLQQIGRAAAFKVAREYDSLKLNDNRAEIEQKIRMEIIDSLKEEKLDTSINVSQILVKQILPADNIVASANLLVQAQNEQKRKEVEVRTARLEADRQNALSANSKNIDYMKAEAMMKIANAVENGKVDTMIIPADMTGILNLGK